MGLVAAPVGAAASTVVDGDPVVEEAPAGEETPLEPEPIVLDLSAHGASWNEVTAADGDYLAGTLRMWDEEGSQAFVYQVSTGTLRPLGAFGGTRSAASGLSGGVLVGEFTHERREYPFAYDMRTGIVQQLSTFAGSATGISGTTVFGYTQRRGAWRSWWSYDLTTQTMTDLYWPPEDVAATPPVVNRYLTDPRIVESSGLARSSYDPAVLFTHNDDDYRARLYAVGADGETDAVLTVERSWGSDVEDVSSGPGGSLWLADIGDEELTRSHVTVYAVSEPSVLEDQWLDSTSYDFVYPDGPHDAAAVLVHPTTGRLYIVTRAETGAAVYEAPAELSAFEPNLLTRYADAPPLVSAAAFSPDGSTVALANPVNTYVYDVLGGEPRDVLTNPTLQQLESLVFDSTGTSLLLGSEGVGSPVLSMTLPVEVVETPPVGPEAPEAPVDPALPEVPEVPEVPVTPPPSPDPVAPAPSAPVSPDAAGDWELQYSTDFTTNSGWTVYDNQAQSNDNSVNMARNVTFGPDGLSILGKRESGYSAPFTSGEIVGKTSDLVVPNYFRAEVTGTFTDESGIWPCLLWFRPDNASDGEIDVMEWMGGMWTDDQKRVAITMHNEYGASQDSIKKPLLLKSNSWFDPNVEHTYTVEKVPGSITVWVDGRKLSTFTATDKGWWDRIMEVEGRTWYPRITLQIGEGATTKVVPDPDDGWTDTEVDVTSYKVWTRS